MKYINKKLKLTNIYILLLLTIFTNIFQVEGQNLLEIKSYNNENTLFYLTDKGEFYNNNIQIAKYHINYDQIYCISRRTYAKRPRSFFISPYLYTRFNTCAICSRCYFQPTFRIHNNYILSDKNPAKYKIEYNKITNFKTGEILFYIGIDPRLHKNVTDEILLFIFNYHIKH